MDYLNQYKDSDESESENSTTTQDNSTEVPSTFTSRHVNINPDVKVSDSTMVRFLPKTGDNVLNFNPLAKDLFANQQGPANPYVVNPTTMGKRNLISGYVQDVNLEMSDFKEQFQTFQNFGYAANPDGSGTFVGNQWKRQLEGGRTIYTGKDKKYAEELRSKRLLQGDVDDIDGYLGPWAGYEDEKEEQVSSYEKGEMTEWQKYWFEKHKEKHKKDNNDENSPTETTPINEEEDRDKPWGEGIELSKTKTKFHGSSQVDYQGRKWTLPPLGLHTDNVELYKSYIPKKCIHKWTGHTDLVQSIQFFPVTGHLILSGSNDKKVKIWDVYNKRECKRTYIGHAGAVRHASFSPDGSQFLSASFDRNVKLWDTETGQCLHNFTKGTIPYQAVWCPMDPNCFICPCQDCNAYQFDIREGKIVQTYNSHLAPVNTVTFFDGGQRFVTTGDDKVLLVWQFGINPPIKKFAEISQTSMPAVTLSANGQDVLCQSLNSQILDYRCGGNTLYFNGKKRFVGHNLQGNACQIATSRDNQYVASGDGTGNVYFWNFYNAKVVKLLKAHNGACFGCIWHPIEPSRIATSGGDGIIKYWD